VTSSLHNADYRDICDDANGSGVAYDRLRATGTGSKEPRMLEPWMLRAAIVIVPLAVLVGALLALIDWLDRRTGYLLSYRELFDVRVHLESLRRNFRSRTPRRFVSEQRQNGAGSRSAQGIE
jgi:hypothetical protein